MILFISISSEIAVVEIPTQVGNIFKISPSKSPFEMINLL